ncbi:snake venom metalloproteinase hemorrhagic factor 2-like [Penaeus chinensis]|uniref:snake venom metalloproteinase hemorrhagic factor 2-like n=1 Tax=Penaeus chinensis TaxID=139456 RepID=UPI001FB73DA2|nr:snake venom metalloproteinase hemorrhagic factor 2-like [Penaeus chinensis]
MYRHYGSGVYQRVREVVSTAAGFLRRLGVVLVLTEVRVWRHGDEIAVSSNRHKTLNKFEIYRDKLLKEEPHLANDNTVLMTRQAFENAAGLAFTGMMCNNGLSSGLVRDDDRSSGIIGHVLAHELGHSLGMKHDEEEYEDTDEVCRCPSGSCLMISSVP